MNTWQAADHPQYSLNKHHTRHSIPAQHEMCISPKISQIRRNQYLYFFCITTHQHIPLPSTYFDYHRFWGPLTFIYHIQIQTLASRLHGVWNSLQCMNFVRAFKGFSSTYLPVVLSDLYQMDFMITDSIRPDGDTSDCFVINHTDAHSAQADWPMCFRSSIFIQWGVHDDFISFAHNEVLVISDIEKWYASNNTVLLRDDCFCHIIL